MAKRCKHEWCEVRRTDGTTRHATLTDARWLAGIDSVFWVRCRDCRHHLALLWPSNDEPAAVRIEMRAAEIAAGGKVNTAEGWGWLDHDDPVSFEQEHPGLDCSDADGWYPGWLAREIATHELRVRDADAWPWDPTRPVAGQYEQSQLEEPWVCPVDSNECAIRRRCTNKCGALDATHAELEIITGPEPEPGIEVEILTSHEINADCHSLGCIEDGAAHDPDEDDEPAVRVRSDDPASVDEIGGEA